MKPKAFAILALIILVAQPLVIASTTFVVPIIENSPSVSQSLSQEPGTRLAPEDHTDHVPIFINGTDDFVSQGWPGSGTTGDPYIIAGLNITYDIGQPCIWIINTDAYFIIRDTYVGQGVTSTGIIIENTTHATIEYVTVSASSGAIRLTSAANTRITYSNFITANLDALEMSYSPDSTIDNNFFKSYNRRALYITNSNGLTLHDNKLQSISPGWYTAYVGNSNDTTVSNEEVEYSGYTAYALGQSYNSDITGLILNSADFGLRILSSPDTIVSGVQVNVSGIGIDTTDSNRTVIQDSTIIQTGGIGISIQSSNDVNITGNLVNNTSGSGIEINTSNGTLVEENEISFASGDGILFSFVDSGKAISNDIHDISGYPIQIRDSHNSLVSKNSIRDSPSSAGVVVQNGNPENITIADNYFENAWGAVYYSGGRNTKIYRNNATEMASYFLAIQAHSDAEVVNNSAVGLVASYGIYLSTAPRAYIEGNRIYDSENGIYFGTSATNVTVIKNTITSTKVGINLNAGSTNTVVDQNTIIGADYGISITNSATSTFSNNNLTNTGFYFELNYPVSTFPQTLPDNFVNGKPVYYNIDTDGLSLDGTNYGQIILVNCSYSTITGGIFPSSSIAIEIVSSRNVTIQDIDIQGQQRGLLVDRSANFTIRDSSIGDTKEYDAIYIYTSVGFMASNLTVTSSSVSGINLYLSNNFTITESQFTDLAGSSGAIFSIGGAYGTVTNSQFTNCSVGVYFNEQVASEVTNNDFLWSGAAIKGVWYSVGINVSFNSIQDGTYGIVVDSFSDNWAIFNNTIRWTDYGISISASTNPRIFFNTIALNFFDNGVDDSANFWDDNVANGNWWDDYTPPGVYNVGGSGGAQDRYPMQYMVNEPIINTPMDIWYAEGSEGNEIFWVPFDNWLKNWEVTVDGDLWAEGIWNFFNITVNVDGLPYGDHTVFIKVWDVDQNWVNDTVIVHVFDDTPPEIDNPPNQWLFVDATGQTIDWEVSDLNPTTYTLEVDGVEFATGTWSSGTLSLNVDDIDEGEHTLVLTVYDIDGNSASDTIIVLVINDDTAPVVTETNDVVYVEGTTGNVIEWDAQDEYPASYQVVFNGSVVGSGSWGGARIIFNVDGLAPGTYEYTVTVYDMSGNSATSSANVTVLPFVPTEPVTPFDPILAIIIGTAIGGVLVAVAVIYYLRKKRTS